ALWCKGGIRETASCYSVDENGFIFASTDTAIASSTHFIYRGAIADEPLGKSLLTPETFKKIQFFVQEFSGHSVDPREAILSDTNYMTIVLASGGQFIINTTDDLSIVLSNIATVI